MAAYQLALIAPFLWMLGTRELMLARMMADQYAYNAGGYRQRYYHEPEVVRGGRPGRGPGGGSPRHYTITQRDGRFVIEEV